MTLNQAHYKRLLKDSAAWRYARWLQVCYASVCLTGGTFLCYVAHTRAASTESWDQEAVAYYPLGMVLFAEGVRTLIVSLVRWRGDPVVSLLLHSLRKDEVALEKPAIEVDHTSRREEDKP